MVNSKCKAEMWEGLVSAAPYMDAEAIVAQLRDDPNFPFLKGIWVLTEIEDGESLPNIFVEVDPYDRLTYIRIVGKIFKAFPFCECTPLTAHLFEEKPNLPVTGMWEDVYFFLTHKMVRKIYLDEAWAKAASERYQEVRSD